MDRDELPRDVDDPVFGRPGACVDLALSPVPPLACRGNVHDQDDLLWDRPTILFGDIERHDGKSGSGMLSTMPPTGHCTLTT